MVNEEICEYTKIVNGNTSVRGYSHTKFRKYILIGFHMSGLKLNVHSLTDGRTDERMNRRTHSARFNTPQMRCEE